MSVSWFYCTARSCGRAEMVRKRLHAKKSADRERADHIWTCPRCEKEFDGLAAVRWDSVIPEWFCVERRADDE